MPVVQEATPPDDDAGQKEACDKCGKSKTFQYAETFQGETYTQTRERTLHKSSIKGVEGVFCRHCLMNAPLFCRFCWAWTRHPFDGSCKNHHEWVKCPDCEASWPLVRPFYHPGYPGQMGGRPENARPPEPAFHLCPACGSREEPQPWGRT